MCRHADGECSQNSNLGQAQDSNSDHSPLSASSSILQIQTDKHEIQIQMAQHSPDHDPQSEFRRVPSPGFKFIQFRLWQAMVQTPNPDVQLMWGSSQLGLEPVGSPGSHHAARHVSVSGFASSPWPDGGSRRFQAGGGNPKVEEAAAWSAIGVGRGVGSAAGSDILGSGSAAGSSVHCRIAGGARPTLGADSNGIGQRPSNIGQLLKQHPSSIGQHREEARRDLVGQGLGAQSSCSRATSSGMGGNVSADLGHHSRPAGRLESPIPCFTCWHGLRRHRCPCGGFADFVCFGCFGCFRSLHEWRNRRCCPPLVFV